MKSKNLIVIYILTLLLTISCKEEKKAAIEISQMQKVMAVHDEVMPKMGTLSRLVAKLKSKVDTTLTGRENEKAMKDLQDANKAMMDWMVNFGDRFDSDEILNGKALNSEKQQWLNEEEKKIMEVRDQINGSIEKAKTLLKEEN
ncbi:MAG: hypothetical protein AAFZ89_01350 [Bacteroidota bacterium]